jgi:dihydropteroate synthase
MILKRMGVMNITPNSFSDSHTSLKDIQKTLKGFGRIEALDIGGESTAPINESISWLEEWKRWQMILPLLPQIKATISADTYHPETIFALVKHWKDHKMIQDLFWNDVSGKFDHHVRDYLKEGKRFQYVYCHNRAPKRELAGKHMEYVGKDEGRLEEELADFFGPFADEKVIFDPCLGFSKNYDENWFILNHFEKFQTRSRHDRWLIGFSRKSFLRKKFNLTLEDKEELDKKHLEVLGEILKKARGEVWVRTHRPELIHGLLG